MPTNKKSSAPTFGDAQVSLLERLSNASAVSGDEGEVRKIVLAEITPHVDEVKVDALGNVLAVKRSRSGAAAPLKVMLDAHMDEVGFMIVHDEGEGIYRFDTVGGLDERQLVGKAVWVGKDHVPGVIGAKPVHLTRPEERKSPITLDTLRIDVGPGKNKVQVGDRAVFATRFRRQGPSLFGKALDDRLGVAVLIELLRAEYNPAAAPGFDLLAAFSVQEEIGLRGARVAAYALQPDLAIAIDSTPANDIPTWDGAENTLYNTRLGAGPALYVADSATLSDPRLVRYLAQIAEALGIPYQFRQPGGGGTDAGAIHQQRAGIPSISVSIPGRYPHTASGMARLEDWQHTFALLHAALERLPADLLAVER
jgi:tetrahedral aminopeptidase